MEQHNVACCFYKHIILFVYACPAKEPVLAPPPLYLGGRMSTLVDFVFFFHCCELLLLVFAFANKLLFNFVGPCREG
jgi:hypothetical protein